MQHQISAMHLRATSITLVVAVIVLLVVATPSAQAQTYSVLYSFTGISGDGSSPYGGLVRDSSGDLWGTTFAGGTYGFGTVFKLDTSGIETVLYSFTGIAGDGANPQAGLVRDAAGNLYGTTRYGGTVGLGTVFKLDTSGTETVLHSFTGSGGDGANPQAGLIRDAAGNLYGTTYYGGNTRCGSPNGCGTVFEVNKTGKEKILEGFAGPTDGKYPLAGLVQDGAGSLYGTTTHGGTSGSGTVFKLDSTDTLTILHSFFGGSDGLNPSAGLVRDAAGNLYGTTADGGSPNLGTVFRLDAKGAETVLHSFTGYPDGSAPYAGVIRDAAGNLYGTTTHDGTGGFGTVFKVDSTGIETVLYSFTGTPDGSFPVAGLIRDTAGNLYGTTANGGTYGLGTVFKLTP